MNNFCAITIVCENTVKRNGLLAEHGFCLWIETPDAHILLDTGQGLALKNNINQLSIPLETADGLVISHGHYDHTGGLPWVLEQTHCPVYLHPKALLPERYSIREGRSRRIEMPEVSRNALEKHPDRLRITSEPNEIASGVFATGYIPRRKQHAELQRDALFLDAGGTTRDPVEDDQAVWIETPHGLVILLGCAHAGIMNTMDHILEHAKTDTILALIGGMHLTHATPQQITTFAEALKPYHIPVLVPCHCTGFQASAALFNLFPNQVTPGSVGAKYFL